MKNQPSKPGQNSDESSNSLTLRRVFNHLIFKLKFHYAVIVIYKHAVDRGCTAAVEIKRVDFDNVDDAITYEVPKTILRFKKFLRRGDWGYYAYREGEWAHRSWVALGPQTVKLWKKFLPLKLDEREVLIWNCETAEGVRGKDIFSAVLCRIVRDSKASNFNNIYIATTGDNLASQKAILKSGFKELEWKRVINFLGMTFVGGGHQDLAGIHLNRG